MFRKLLTAGVLLLVTAAPARAATPPGRDARAMLLLKENCFACHNPQKHKGELVLTTRELALRGNDSGPALVPGKSANSRLVRALSPDADPHMPPKKQLAPDEVAALRDWIDAGAAWDQAFLAARRATTQPVHFTALPADFHPVLAVAISPDGSRLAAARGNQVFVHDLANPDRPAVATHNGPRDVVQSLAWSPGGRRLAAGDHQRIVVWDSANPTAPLILTGAVGRVTALRFLADDWLVAADSEISGPGRLLVYRLPETRPQTTILAHSDAVYSLASSGNGLLLASGAADKLVKLWDTASMKEVAQLEGHTGHVLAVAFSPDGSLLASAGADRDLKVWDVKTREQKFTAGPHPAAVTAVAFSPDGKNVLAACEDGTVRLHPNDATRSGRGGDAGRPFPPASDVLYSLAVSPDGKTVYAGCHDGNVYVWSADGVSRGKIPPP